MTDEEFISQFAAILGPLPGKDGDDSGYQYDEYDTVYYEGQG